ncbi:hypothetical protein J5226_19490 [Lysobacter sp. K5869]|uniref:hypothetical protein n=1 Tax=Lysobacter sp. K5869 TaxID=2820808 RepID=UPI001C060ACD|nr:hypothetical protein [Lysobacter sp. K5869]QWP75771.1 hypothetical protein J5226_19490 [Lysobacter sp. K5869]
MTHAARKPQVRRTLARLAAASLCLLAAAQAQAAYPCNGAGPGRDMVGMTQAGQGLAAVPLCEDHPAAPSSPSAPQTPPDPMRALLGDAYARVSQGFLNAQHKLEERQRIDSDPQYKRLVQGQWDFFPKGDGGRDDSCAAMFSNNQGVVRVMGPGPGFKGATLTFWGTDIPKPKSMDTVRMTLLQPKAPPTTVPVFNYYNPAEKLGAVVFVVPSIEAALGAFEETQHFEVAQDGKSLIKIDWTGGVAAREKLRQCVKRHPH